MLAALGPKMLALSGEAADGAHPYLTTPEHTARAREILGPDKLLFVEQKVMLCEDAGRARESARAELEVYLGLPNYRNSWKRLGYSEEQIDAAGDDFLDAMVAWGDEAALRERIEAHDAAGATHVLHPARDPGDAAHAGRRRARGPRARTLTAPWGTTRWRMRSRRSRRRRSRWPRRRPTRTSTSCSSCVAWTARSCVPTSPIRACSTRPTSSGCATCSASPA